MTCKWWKSPNGHEAKVPGKGDCKSRPLALSFQVVVLYRHILLFHFTQTCVHVWLKKTSIARILHFHGSGATWLSIHTQWRRPNCKRSWRRCDFLAAMMQQQQTAIEAMMNNERGRPAAQAQGINEKYYKRVESFTGQQSWRDWSFQFKSATNTANEAAYHLIETAEVEEKGIDDALSLTVEMRSLSSGIFNILGTLVKGEPLQMLHTSGSSGFEAWRKLSKRYSSSTPMRGMQLMMAAINPGKAKGLEEVLIHIDRWEAKVLALSRDFNELLSEKMRAAILISMLPPDLQMSTR